MTWPTKYDRFGGRIEPDDQSTPKRGWPFVDVDDDQVVELEEADQ